MKRMSGAWCLAAMTVASVCVSGAAQEETTESTGTPRLQLSTQEWNFGQAWEGQPLECEVVLTNIGDAPLTFTRVRTSCGCTTPTDPKSPLAPGESDTIKIRYRKRLGRADSKVTFETNDPIRPRAVIRVKGHVKSIFRRSPKEGLLFGLLSRSSREQRQMTFTNQYPEPIFLKLKEGQDLGPFAVEFKELDPGQRYELTATTMPPLESQRYQHYAYLITTSAQLPEFGVLLHASVRPPISVSEDRLLMPKTAVVEMKRVINVSLAPDSRIRVTSVKSSHAAIKVDVEEVTAEVDGKRPVVYRVTVILPPGDRLPDGAEPFIEILTTSSEPEYEKLVIPIKVIGPRSRPAAGPPR